jgi:catechol 2,3-dioxygenase-like lactoylglutathione lyase family enzyme
MLPLSQSKITTNLPVKDLDRARSFYEGKLGFSRPQMRAGDGAAVYDVAGASIALLPKTEGTKAEHTALSFQVQDIREGVQALEKAGIKFEDYDLPGFKTVNHIFEAADERCAWFLDTEGNYLCLHESKH